MLSLKKKNIGRIDLNYHRYKSQPLILRILRLPHQRSNGSALETGRRKMSGSIPDRVCKFILFVVFLGFLRNSCKYGLGSLKKIPKDGSPSQDHVSNADRPYNAMRILRRSF